MSTNSTSVNSNMYHPHPQLGHPIICHQGHVPITSPPSGYSQSLPHQYMNPSESLMRHQHTSMPYILTNPSLNASPSYSSPGMISHYYQQPHSSPLSHHSVIQQSQQQQHIPPLQSQHSYYIMQNGPLTPNATPPHQNSVASNSIQQLTGFYKQHEGQTSDNEVTGSGVGNSTVSGLSLLNNNLVHQFSKINMVANASSPQQQQQQLTTQINLFKK